jgi:hypothetical protein
MDQNPNLVFGICQVPGESLSNKTSCSGDEDFLHSPHYSITSLIPLLGRGVFPPTPLLPGINLASTNGSRITPVKTKRNHMEKVGFHYRPDSEHYSEKDLALWLPKLKELEASFVVLRAQASRAIPESFLTPLKEEGIEPVVHIPLRVEGVPDLEEMILLFEIYQKWGLKYLVLFDRPNQQESWRPDVWVQSILTERFLDAFLPLAEAAVAQGMVPVFPPLEPGGDYWDTIFLRESLDGLKRRASGPLLDRILLSAYGGLHGKPLSWGGGGPQSWPEAQPYYTPESSEDQRGFRIPEWYLTLSETVLERKLPLLLLGIRGPTPEGNDPGRFLVDAARLLARQTVGGSEPLPEEVLGGAFWVLTGGEDCCAPEHHWFGLDGEPHPIVRSFLERDLQQIAVKATDQARISHYLLLPSFEWGVADWHLKVTRPFIKRHRPTVGFSLEEALGAEQVTVVGGEEHFSAEDLSRLRSEGCLVRRIEGDGTKIASQLAAI